MRFSSCFGLALALGLLAGCEGKISVTFFTGPRQLTVSSSSFALPAELDDGAGRIASYPCGPMGMCPPSDELTIACEAGTCDPAPVTVSGPVGEVVDVYVLLIEAGEIGIREIQSYTIEEVAYEVRLNTLSFDVEPIDVYWGPESATTIDPGLGVRRVGTVPQVRAGQTPHGTLELDEEGAAALAEYLVSTSSRVRFFASTAVDLEPGQPIPQGDLTVAVNATLTAVGRVL
ncbi:MAG TPA: hypothetical protein VIL20_19985 [Sandaracinaceae bacterium]